MASAYVGSYYEARMPTDFAKRLTDAARRKLPDSAFCGVGRSYPVPDRNHALAAIAYAKKYRGSHKLSAEQADHILACVHAKYPELHNFFSRSSRLFYGIKITYHSVST